MMLGSLPSHRASAKQSCWRSSAMPARPSSRAALIGVMLVAEGIEKHIERGYIYFAMAFSLVVELLNQRLRKREAPAAGKFTKVSSP